MRCAPLYGVPVNALYQRRPHRELASPVLLLATETWVDAGLGARAAISHVLETIPTEPIAGFDADLLVDFRARRPTAQIADGVVTRLVWPEIELRAGADSAGHDLLALVGPEPDMRWHGFVRAVVELAAELGVRLVVGLGAYPAPVPHTRPVPLSAIATEAELAAKVGIVSGTIEVPAGIQTALQRGFAAAGIPAIGIWARVPHYLATMPYPPAAAALVDALASVSGLLLPSTELEAAAGRTGAQLEEIIAQNDEHRELVRQLEAAFDAQVAGEADLANLPSGDEIAAELERFLRGQPEG